MRVQIFDLLQEARGTFRQQLAINQPGTTYSTCKIYTNMCTINAGERRINGLVEDSSLRESDYSASRSIILAIRLTIFFILPDSISTFGCEKIIFFSNFI